MNVLRRLPLSRLLLLCGLSVAVAISAAALAFALDAGPTPPPRPLAQAVRDALGGQGRESIKGLSASVTLTNHVLEGADLVTGGEQAGSGLLSSPLVKGASGRLWVSASGHVRLELQAEQGDTQILYDGHTVTIYDAASNTVYRYTPRQSGATTHEPQSEPETPSLSSIESAIARIDRHANLSGAVPTDVAGQPAYTVRIAPEENGSLLGGGELSFDAENGVPLRAAIYSSTTSTPAVELAAQEISFGPVSESVFEVTPPSSAKVEELVLGGEGKPASHGDGKERPQLQVHGHGVTAIAVLSAKAGKQAPSLGELPKVEIDGVGASELRTELGTVLTFARAGRSYVLAGAVPATAIEALARSL